MSKSNSGSSKRPADELQGPDELQAPAEQQQSTSLHRLAAQIAFFESQAAEGTEPPPAKKGAQLHCLVQNTTHRKIRWGGGRGTTAGRQAMLGDCRRSLPPPPPPPPTLAAACPSLCFPQGRPRAPGRAAAPAAAPPRQEVRAGWEARPGRCSLDRRSST